MPILSRSFAHTDEECDKIMMKRIEANDPVALRQQGHLQYNKGEYIAEAHYKLSAMYLAGRGVEKNVGRTFTTWKRQLSLGIQKLDTILDYTKTKKMAMVREQ